MICCGRPNLPVPNGNGFFFLPEGREVIIGNNFRVLG